MLKRNRNGRNYIELAVVIAILLIITLFVIPRYQNLKRDAYRAQIANDSMVLEKRIATRLSTKGQMPKEYKTISNENLATLVDSKNSYLKGELIKSNDVKAIGGSKYMLPQNDILDSINTKLKGEFIYTDSGVIYIDNVKSVDLDKVIPKVTGTAQPEHVLSGETFANKYNLNLTGTMPKHDSLSKTLTKQGEIVKIDEGYYPNGEIKVDIKNLDPTNIKKGVNIGGIEGSYESSLNMKSEKLIFDRKKEGYWETTYHYETSKLDKKPKAILINDIYGRYEHSIGEAFVSGTAFFIENSSGIYPIQRLSGGGRGWDNKTELDMRIKCNWDEKLNKLKIVYYGDELRTELQSFYPGTITLFY